MFKFKPKFRLSIALLAASLLLIFLHYFGILSPLENLVVKILSPVQWAVYSVVTRFKPQSAAQPPAAVRDLLVENARLQVQLAEYESLKKQLQLLQTNDFNYVIGRVLTKDVAGEQQILIINVGKNQGLKVGLPVIVEDGSSRDPSARPKGGAGILIGKIVAVKNNFSQVMLLTDNQSQTAAAVSGANHTIGVVSGESGLNLKMELIPKDEPVAVGEVVVTSGLEPNIPPGLVIGEVAEISEPGGGFFKTAYLKSLVSLDKINVVSILLPEYWE